MKLRKIKVKILRFFKAESGAHMRARIKRELRALGKRFRQELLFKQGGAID